LLAKTLVSDTNFEFVNNFMHYLEFCSVTAIAYYYLLTFIALMLQAVPSASIAMA